MAFLKKILETVNAGTTSSHAAAAAAAAGISGGPGVATSLIPSSASIAFSVVQPGAYPFSCTWTFRRQHIREPLDRFGIDVNDEGRIIAIAAGSDAARALVPQGWIVVKICGMPVRSKDDFFATVNRSLDILLEMFSPEAMDELTVRVSKCNFDWLDQGLRDGTLKIEDVRSMPPPALPDFTEYLRRDKDRFGFLLFEHPLHVYWANKLQKASTARADMWDLHKDMVLTEHAESAKLANDLDRLLDGSEGDDDDDAAALSKKGAGGGVSPPPPPSSLQGGTRTAARPLGQPMIDGGSSMFDGADTVAAGDTTTGKDGVVANDEDDDSDLLDCIRGAAQNTPPPPEQPSAAAAAPVAAGVRIAGSALRIPININPLMAPAIFPGPFAAIPIPIPAGVLPTVVPPLVAGSAAHAVFAFPPGVVPRPRRGPKPHPPPFPPPQPAAASASDVPATQVNDDDAEVDEEVDEAGGPTTEAKTTIGQPVVASKSVSPSHPLAAEEKVVPPPPMPPAVAPPTSSDNKLLAQVEVCADFVRGRCRRSACVFRHTDLSGKPLTMLPSARKRGRSPSPVVDRRQQRRRDSVGRRSADRGGRRLDRSPPRRADSRDRGGRKRDDSRDRRRRDSRDRRSSRDRRR